MVTIKVSSETWKKLNRLKLSPSESFDSLILSLYDFYISHNLEEFE